MELLIIIGLILLNGVFAISELAVLSSRKIRLQEMAEADSKGAQTALKLKDAPNRFLSTVQVGITLVGIMAGAFGGAAVADSIAEQLARIPALGESSQAIAFAIVIGFTAYLSLVIGELVPKYLALQNPERIAVIVARPMNTLATVACPIVYILDKSTKLVVRLLGVKPSTDPDVSESEILYMMRQGIDTGIFEESEQEMVEAVFRLDDQRARAIVTPRTGIMWLDIDDTPEETLLKIGASGYSHYPVCKGSIEKIIGIVQVKDVWAQTLNKKPLDLKAVMHKPLFLPENVTISEVLERIRRSPVHVVLIVDEHGGIEGLVTLHDLLEEIVGEVDVDAPEAVQREDGSWLLGGTLTIFRLVDIFPNISFLKEGIRDYETLAGLIMTRLGYVPREADHFTWKGLYFEIMDMDGNRIDKVMVKRMENNDEQTRTT